ncbi:PIG-L deacetylase family protein [Nesterenkonia sphaerica]|uniref:PIG-L family deacetylase n=1 Tax=Nesterenkonia sphaerica TaxID=1804988 RepID=A0A5R9AG69_9MICC|nr:PIG-L deacetylase family protein [Nesterenkonia sphaerica]TLP76816.1 PIG-L family deacetylase [Nesterenkonia sphaerica]
MGALPVFDDSGVRRVLCVVAHPDDMEYGGSAAVARWTAMGVEVSYLLLTAGEAGMRNVEPASAAQLRIQEQRQACGEVGMEDLTVLSLPDGMLQPDLETRRQFARHIRRFQPDVVFTQPWELQVAWGLNHADHRATGLATVDAIRDADNPWVFRDLVEQEGLEPWGAQWLLVPNSEPDFLIDVSGEPVEQAVRSLEAHRAYLEALGDHPEPREMIEGMTAAAAQRSEDPSVTRALAVAAYRM